MGTGVVDLGGEDGFYVVTLDYGIEQKAQQLARLQEVITLLEANLLEYPPFYAEVDALIAQTVVSLDAAIQIYQLNLSIDPTSQETKDAADGVNDILANKLRLEGERQEIQARENIIKGQLAEAQRRQTFLNNVEAEVTTAAWCADFTEDKTGAINTIEIPGEPQTVIIEPQSREPDATPALLPAGVTVARELMSPEQVYFNAAVLPGWQRFKPTYRRGTILALDFLLDTATVRIEEAVSSARDINLQTLNINRDNPPTLTLENVPVTYMTCNAAAFEVDDQVVVMFEDQSWDNPHVIGFIREPKPCNVYVMALHGYFWDPIFGDPLIGRVYFSLLVVMTTAGNIIQQSILETGDIEPRRFEGAFSRERTYWFTYGLLEGFLPEDRDYKAIVKVDDNDVFDLPERMRSIVRYKQELFGIIAGGPADINIMVLDSKTLEEKRTFLAWTYPSGAIFEIDVNADRIVGCGETGSGGLYNLQTYDLEGNLQLDIVLPVPFSIPYDIATSADWFAALHTVGNSAIHLFVYDAVTGVALDSVELGPQWESLTIHGNEIAVLRGFDPSESASGQLRLYRFENGIIEFLSESSPFEELLSTVSYTFGNPSIGR